MRRKLVFATVAIMLSFLMFPQIAVAPPSTNSLNAKFMKWQEKENVIHILVYDDTGRSGQPPASVAIGQPVIFGYELVDATTDLLQDWLDDPNNEIGLSVDGGAFFSVKSGFQTPFIAATGSGPRWSWDHDGDGKFDKDGDGIDDWDGPTLFYRYLFSGITAGTHTFDFGFSLDGGLTYYYIETITVVAI